MLSPKHLPIVSRMWEVRDSVISLDRLPTEILLRIFEFLDPLALFELAQTCKNIYNMLPELSLEHIIFVLHNKNDGCVVDSRFESDSGCAYNTLVCYCKCMFRHRGLYGDVRAFERACEQGDLRVIKYLRNYRNFNLGIGTDYENQGCLGDINYAEIEFNQDNGRLVELVDGPFLTLASQYEQHMVAKYLLEECGVNPWARDLCGLDMTCWIHLHSKFSAWCGY